MHEPRPSSGATTPEDLARLFVERANAGDVDGLVALYERDASLAFPAGSTSTGTAAIRNAYAAFLATGPVLTVGKQRPTLCSGDLALTSTRLRSGAVTAEVARRQPDGTWRWILDDPNVLI